MGHSYVKSARAPDEDVKMVEALKDVGETSTSAYTRDNESGLSVSLQYICHRVFPSV
jgi:hypothetical protein